MAKDIYNLDKYKPSNIKNQTAFYHWLRRLITMKTTTFKWTGLPKEINERYLEYVLLMYGKVAFAKDAITGDLIALPFNIAGNFDLYGEPKKVQLFSGYAGYSDFFEDGKFVICYDNYLKQPVISDLLMYADKIADLDRTIDVQVSVQKTPYMLAGEKGIMTTAKKILENVTNNDVSVEVDANFKMAEAIKVLQLVPPNSYNGNILTDTLERTVQRAYEFLGIESKVSGKKERLLTSEVESSNASVTAQKLSYLKPRLECCTVMKEVFGLDVKVELNKDIIDEEGSEYDDYRLSDIDRGVSNSSDPV